MLSCGLITYHYRVSIHHAGPLSQPDDLSLGVSGQRRPWGFGFGYGVAWVSFILISLSTALLICDRESEEIFYKEKIVDDDEEEEEEEEA